MIWMLAYFACALWFTFWLAKFVYIAFARGYVMARKWPFPGARETPHTRLDDPFKYWAGVTLALLILPMAVGGLYFATSDLWRWAHQQEY